MMLLFCFVFFLPAQRMVPGYRMQENDCSSGNDMTHCDNDVSDNDYNKKELK